MLTVYHPRSWAHNWPRGAKPYATRSLCEALEKTNDIMESTFNGAPHDVVTEAPTLTKQEEQFVTENPGTVVEAVTPEVTPEPPAPVEAPRPKTAPLSKFRKLFSK